MGFATPGRPAGYYRNAQSIGAVKKFVATDQNKKGQQLLAQLGGKRANSEVHKEKSGGFEVKSIKSLQSRLLAQERESMAQEFNIKQGN